MAIRQWMTTHEWMVKYTPQTEWIERRGILVWIAEVFTSLGAGLYLVSLFYNNLWGMFVAWLIIVFLKLPPHIIYFGKPLRFWRTIPPFTDAWKTSWFCRGITFTVLFTGFAFIQLVLTYFFPGTGWDIAFKIIAGITAFLVGIYSGFIMNYCRSIPFWNSALLPLVFLFCGIADGFALLMAIALTGGQVDIMAVEAGSRVLLTVSALIMATYLWSATYTSSTAKQSVIELIRGNIALVFWIGTVAFGIIIPLVISAVSYFVGEASTPLLIIAIACHTIGAFALKYCLLKAGIHNPILPATFSKQIV
jgi:formate-dependent nitrite reductase membrane component NrfD